MGNRMSDIEIAQSVTPKPIEEIAAGLDLSGDDLELYGKYKAKISLPAVRRMAGRPDGKLILVTAITPTPAGEGKTTTTVGLGDALRRLGKKTVLALREPSLGPVFGIKGGAAGGGWAQIMAILCLADGLTDLKERLASIVVGYSRSGDPVTAGQLKAQGAMAALLKDAIKPNLVQTLEHTPALIHGGPFANIAHGCNSVMATRLALKLGDYVVTEAGFGADLGAEKFLDIKCRKAGLSPDAVVIVATVRALKHHGGAEKSRLGEENPEALEKGLPNLLGHIENITQRFGLPAVVAINRFPDDTPAELELVREKCAAAGANVALSEVWGKGGEGGLELARQVLKLTEQPAAFRFIYPDDMSLKDKINSVVQNVYGGEGTDYLPAASKELDRLEQLGYGRLPVCLAKTQYSFSDNPALLGRPHGFRVTVKSVRLAAGAGFVVALTGDIMTMPGLPKIPAAESIDVDENGKISGLF